MKWHGTRFTIDTENQGQQFGSEASEESARVVASMPQKPESMASV